MTFAQLRAYVADLSNTELEVLDNLIDLERNSREKQALAVVKSQLEMQRA